MNKSLKILVNIVILAVVVTFVWYVAHSTRQQEVFRAVMPEDDTFESRFELHASFEISQEINRFELHDNRLYILAEDTVFVYDIVTISGTPTPTDPNPQHIIETTGWQTASFGINPNARDITVDTANEEIYILYHSHIEVYNFNGELLREWASQDNSADYCSIALVGNSVFATDAGNKVIRRYTLEGDFVTNIISPNRFVIPSFSFDIEVYNDTVFVINSGRHLIEIYTQHGQYIASFGTPGGAPGYFMGCCNPSFISFTPAGYLITSEKGIPRVSVFTRDGTFREVLLTGRLLGIGNRAFETRTDGEKLFVAGRNRIMIFK